MIGNFLKKAISLLFILIIITMPVYAFDDLSTGKSLDITSRGAIVVDLNTDSILYKRNINQQCRPASLTKMMTLLVAYEQTVGRHDELVSLTEKMISVPSGSSSAYLKNGDKISIRDLFYAMMLPSGNDAAKALAYIVSGNEENFALLMNDKARELGMKGSNFKNAHGFDEDGHYTTTYDLALLSIALCKNEDLVKVFSSYKHTVTIYSNGDMNTPTTQTYYNTNNLLNPNLSVYFPGYKGIKTGFTALAGNCLAGYYDHNGRKLVAITTFSQENHRDPDMTALLKYGLESFDTLNLNEVFASKKIIVDLENASNTDESNGQLELYLDHPKEAKYITVSASVGKKIRTFDEGTVSIRYPLLKAPQKIGETVGIVEYIYNNQVIYSVPAKASRTVDAEIISPSDLNSLGIKGKNKLSFGFLTSKFFLIPFFTVIILLVVFGLWIYFRKQQTIKIIKRQKNGIGRRKRRRASSRPGNRNML